MSGRYRVQVHGPLEEFAEGFRASLARSGYAWCTVEAQLGLMKHLSAWLESEDLTAQELTAQVTARFVDTRRQSHTFLRSPRALVPLLEHLRALGAVPQPSVDAVATPAQVIEERFVRYLTAERCLAVQTVRSYRDQARPFLVRYAAGGWASLTAGQVRDFVTLRSLGQCPRSSAVGGNALRALLRWMWREQLIAAPLADAVDSFAAPTGTSVPRALSHAQVAELFAALPAADPVRLRDEAMLALMHRLALRAGEIATLRLEDIDWRRGVFAVHGKGGRFDEMPLPADVGTLVAAYLRHGRPTASGHRQVFLAVDAPHRPLSGSAVSGVASRALSRAGIAGPGAAHRLRHTAACGVRRAGRRRRAP